MSEERNLQQRGPMPKFVERAAQRRMATQQPPAPPAPPLEDWGPEEEEGEMNVDVQSSPPPLPPREPTHEDQVKAVLGLHPQATQADVLRAIIGLRQHNQKQAQTLKHLVAALGNVV